MCPSSSSISQTMAALPQEKSRVFVSEALTPAPKRIVVCCDGTWQSSVSLDPKKSVPSNVTRLCRVLASAGTGSDGQAWQQVVYYDAGVGTGDITWLETVRQGSQGLGLLENVIEAYNFIVNNYTRGDKLYFFGFSRGAYTVRSAAGLVTQIGVLQPSSMRKFMKLYGRYIRTGTDEDFKNGFSKYPPWKKFVDDSKGAHAVVSKKDVRIEVIGVWDTVGALGVPDMGHWFHKDNSASRARYSFHQTDLSKKVLHAYQALALDERRKPFSPSVWYLKPTNDATKLLQCWFPGAHIHVGGGSSANASESAAAVSGDREGISLISYAWMLDRLRPHLAFLERDLEQQIQEIKSVSLAHTHDSAGGGGGSGHDSDDEEEEKPGYFWGAVGWVKGALWEAAPARAVDALDYGMGDIADSHTWEYKLMGWPEDRAPGAYHWTADEAAKPAAARRRTRERIHRSVHFRQEMSRTKTPYVPHALKGWERVEVKEGQPLGAAPRERDEPTKGFAWVRYKEEAGRRVADAYVWEYEMRELPKGRGLERKLIDSSETARELNRHANQSYKKEKGEAKVRS